MLRGAAHGAAALACAVLLGACGGGGGGAESETAQVSLPSALAEDLAEQSEAIAASLETGDECAAANQADALLASVVEAIQAGEVPAAYQEELTATANELVNEVNCPPPPSPEDEDDDEDKDDDKGKGNGNGKGKGNGKGNGEEKGKGNDTDEGETTTEEGDD